MEGLVGSSEADVLVQCAGSENLTKGRVCHVSEATISFVVRDEGLENKQNFSVCTW